jgi:hypothetical protein
LKISGYFDSTAQKIAGAPYGTKKEDQNQDREPGWGNKRTET